MTGWVLVPVGLTSHKEIKNQRCWAFTMLFYPKSQHHQKHAGKMKTKMKNMQSSWKKRRYK